MQMKKTYFRNGLIVLGVVILVITLFFSCRIRTNVNMVYVPLSKSECTNMTYEEVEQEFKKSGFKHVEVKSVENKGVVFGLGKKEALKVKEVEIDGDKNMPKNKMCDENVKVIIYYYEGQEEKN